jgi:hypothetical protein
MDYKGEWGGGGPGHSWALKWHEGSRDMCREFIIVLSATVKIRLAEILRHSIVFILKSQWKQCCGSGIFISDRSRILILSIPDPGSNSTKRGGGKICWYCFFCSHKYHRIVIHFIFEQLKNFFFVTTLLPKNLH